MNAKCAKHAARFCVFIMLLSHVPALCVDRYRPRDRSRPRDICYHNPNDAWNNAADLMGDWIQQIEEQENRALGLFYSFQQRRTGLGMTTTINDFLSFYTRLDPILKNYVTQQLERYEVNAQ